MAAYWTWQKLSRNAEVVLVLSGYYFRAVIPITADARSAGVNWGKISTTTS